MSNNLNFAKIPPHSTELEEVVLGALLIEKEAIDLIVDKLKPESFYNEKNRMIYDAILTLYTNTNPIDLITVSNKLKEAGNLEKVGGLYYLTGLSDRVVSSANLEFHAIKLQDLYVKREIIVSSHTLIEDCYKPETYALDVLTKSDFKKDEMLNTITARKEMSAGQVFRENTNRLLKIQDTPNGMTGVPSGLIDIDRLTGGWQNSDLIIIAGRPAMGKTAFVITSAVNSAIHHNVPGVIFSLEMSNSQLMNRITSNVANIPLERFRKGTLTDPDWTAMQNVSELIENSPLFFDDTPQLNIVELSAKARRLKRQQGIKWVIVDYLQLMQGKDRKGGNREQEISSIARGLKGLAKELDIPVIALSQLSRAVESRSDKRPVLSDLRESGAIEQDADVVCFLYRPEYYGITEDFNGFSIDPGSAEFIIAKHRNGATDDVVLRFKASTTAFYDDNIYSEHTKDIF